MAALLISTVTLTPRTGGASMEDALRNARRIAAGIQQRFSNVQVSPVVYKGYLARGDMTVISVVLQAGVHYFLIGAGCGDCYDLDLVLVDENNNLIDRDVLTDAVPVVQVTPRWTGEFRIGVKMANSSADGAHWVLLTAMTASD